MAADAGVEVELVERWQELFLAGGRQRLSGRGEPGSWEARERFLALIAHEFRTPLSIIGGWAETLRTMNLTPAQREQGLATISRQVRHLERITRDALDSALVATGSLRLHLDTVDLRALAREVAAGGEAGRVVVAPGPPLPVVLDRARIEQVVGAMVAIAVRHAGTRPVEITVGERRSVAVVDITSHGEPLSYEDAQTLFEPFARPDTSRLAGLGLYLCRAMVVAHEGELGVRGEGASTTFWFRLPLAGPAPAA